MERPNNRAPPLARPMSPGSENRFRDKDMHHASFRQSVRRSARSEVVSHDDLTIDNVSCRAKACTLIEPASPIVLRLYAEDDARALG